MLLLLGLGRFLRGVLNLPFFLRLASVGILFGLGLFGLRVGLYTATLVLLVAICKLAALLDLGKLFFSCH